MGCGAWLRKPLKRVLHLLGYATFGQRAVCWVGGEWRDCKGERAGYPFEGAGGFSRGGIGSGLCSGGGGLDSL